MRASAVLALALACAVLAVPFAQEPTVAYINTGNFTWSAQENHQFDGMTLDELRGMMGGLLRPPKAPMAKFSPAEFPESFDSRTQWPGCVHPIRNQGVCGSCWAFSASETLSDRGCIATSGSTNVILSPEELVSCDHTDDGCGGGYLENAWAFMEDYGLVQDSCLPYSASNNSVPACPCTGSSDGTCTCTGSGSWSTYYAKSGSTVTLGTAANIQSSLMADGPVSTCFIVYEDFLSYSCGVYVHQSGEPVAGHCVKIVGWGYDESTPYWIVANSWGTTWGSLGGYFWILAGQNECEIESNSIVGQA